MREKYVVAVVGFENVDKAVDAVTAAMKNEGIWIYTIAGTSGGTARIAAERLGAPFLFLDSVKKLERECNYFVVDLAGGQSAKNFMMHLRSVGKRGYAVK